ncbi:hypothetical protein, partial [Aeromonas veronii]
SRKQEAGSRKQEAGSRKQEAGSRKQEAGEINRDRWFAKHNLTQQSGDSSLRQYAVAKKENGRDIISAIRCLVKDSS